MEGLRNNTVQYVPGVLKISKALILSPEDYDKLAEDISPEYPFLKDNRDHMKADPGGWFHALLTMTETGSEGMLLAQGKGGLYVGLSRDVQKLDLQGIPTERIKLEEPTVYDGQYSRNAYTPQSYCAAYVAAKKYGLDVSGFSFERVCQLCSGLEPQAQRRFLSDAKQAAYAVERIVRRGLREMELSVTPEADYSVEQKAAVKESGQPKPGKVKKAAQPERE